MTCDFLLGQVPTEQLDIFFPNAKAINYSTKTLGYLVLRLHWKIGSTLKVLFLTFQYFFAFREADPLV